MLERWRLVSRCSDCDVLGAFGTTSMLIRAACWASCCTGQLEAVAVVSAAETGHPAQPVRAAFSKQTEENSRTECSSEHLTGCRSCLMQPEQTAYEHLAPW
jgi:hypothetical protein